MKTKEEKFKQAIEKIDSVLSYLFLIALIFTLCYGITTVIIS